MKMVMVPLEEDIHRKLKIYLFEKGGTMKEFVRSLIIKEVATSQEEIDFVINKYEENKRKRLELREQHKIKEEKRIKKLEENEIQKKQAADEFRKKAKKEYARYGKESPFDKKNEEKNQMD